MERFYYSLKSEQVYYADNQTQDEVRKGIVDYISKCSRTVAGLTYLARDFLSIH